MLDSFFTILLTNFQMFIMRYKTQDSRLFLVRKSCGEGKSNIILGPFYFYSFELIQISNKLGIQAAFERTLFWFIQQGQLSQPLKMEA